MAETMWKKSKQHTHYQFQQTFNQISSDSSMIFVQYYVTWQLNDKPFIIL